VGPFGYWTIVTVRNEKKLLDRTELFSDQRNLAGAAALSSPI
jgi:hypothetical protein